MGHFRIEDEFQAWKKTKNRIDFFHQTFCNIIEHTLKLKCSVFADLKHVIFKIFNLKNYVKTETSGNSVRDKLGQIYVINKCTTIQKRVPPKIAFVSTSINSTFSLIRLRLFVLVYKY